MILQAYGYEEVKIPIGLICTFIILLIWCFWVENINFFVAQDAWMAESVILQAVMWRPGHSWWCAVDSAWWWLAQKNWAAEVHSDNFLARGWKGQLVVSSLLCPGSTKAGQKHSRAGWGTGSSAKLDEPFCIHGNEDLKNKDFSIVTQLYCSYMVLLHISKDKKTCQRFALHFIHRTLSRNTWGLTLCWVWFCKEVGKEKSNMLWTTIFWGQNADKFGFPILLFSRAVHP